MVVHLNLVTAVMAVVDLRAFENKDAVADHAVVEVQRTFGLENKMLQLADEVEGKVATAEVIEQASALEIFSDQVELTVAWAG